MHLRKPLGRRFIGWTLIVAAGLFFTTASFGVEHVIHISVDGLNAAMMQQLIDESKAPNFRRFQDEGVWTTNARADYTHTNTLPNHTCMFTGRPVAQPEGMPNTVHHGWSMNKAPGRGGTLHNQGNPNLKYVASVFDVAHDAGLSTGLYAAKDKFELYDTSYDENNGAEHERGRDKIDVFFTAADGPPRFSQSVNDRFLDDMAQRHFNYVFVHYRDPDTIGHALSWGSGGWFLALRNADAYLGEVFRLVESDPKLAGRTAIILNTDHGGIGYGHSDETKADNYTIPVMLWGAGVGRGDLYAINRDTRTDPGADRLDYAAEGQPIRNGDTGNLALSLLELGPIPGSLINAKQDLRVAIPGDYNLDGSVDTADFVLWRKLEGSTDLRADGNRDGRVDRADHDLWKAHVGKTAATSN
ncbi:MAG: alkaline phosphatase family protein [Planctomycetes bacterium]|nr:alkaline phosphatase family protein [Planctomycetota bacterium]